MRATKSHKSHQHAARAGLSLPRLTAVALAVALAACGGPSSDSGTTVGGTTGGTTAQTASTITLSAATAGLINISPSHTEIITATIKDASGKVIPGSVVTFATDSQFGIITPASGKVLSDANGQAVITLSPGPKTGAGTLTVTATGAGSGADTSTITGVVNYSVIGTSGDNVIPNLSLDSSAINISTGKPATFVATLVDKAGAPLVGQVVSFAASDPTLVNFAPAKTALTDSKGQASVIISAGTTSGAGTITASAAVTSGKDATGTPITTQLSATKTFSVTSTGSAGPQLSLSGPTSLPAGSTAKVNISLADANGNALANTLVKFTAQGGLASFNPSGGTALTDSAGKAVIDVIAGGQTGADVVTATATIASGAQATQSIAFAITPAVAPLTPTLALTSDVIAINSKTPATLSAKMLDRNGTPLVNQLVTFSNSDNNIATLSPATTALTNASGIATVQLKSGLVNGAGVVTATAAVSTTDATGKAVVTNLSAQTTYTSTANGATKAVMAITAPTTLSAGTNSTVYAVLVDGNGDPIKNTVVTFASQGGLATFNPTTNTALTDSTGKAAITVIAGAKAGADVITASATTAGGTLVTQAVGLSISAAVGSLTPSMSLDRDRVSITNTQPATLIAKILDKSGAPVANQLVTFINSDGSLASLSPAATALTDATGVASVKLLAGAKTGAGVITATANVPYTDATGTTVTSTLTAQTTYSSTSTGTAGPSISLASQDTKIRVGDSTQLSVQLLAADGTPVKGAFVSFGLQGGLATFNPTSGTALTDANGNAIINMVAGNVTGADIVTATAKLSTGDTVSVSTGFSVTPPTIAMNPVVLGASAIAAGGSVAVSTTVIDTLTNAPYTLPVSVSFSSPCSLAGTAVISSPVLTANGVANTTYQDKGCKTSDVITARVSVGGTSISQSATLNFIAAAPQTLQFASATPSTISIKGAGGKETSTIIFKVVDTNGLPVSNAVVDFSLTNNVGGVSLAPSQGTTQADGTVQTIVSAGTVANIVRVNAVLHSNAAIQTVSGNLTISSGLPHQNGFSLSASTHNPEFYSRDGQSITLTVFAADHFGNKVPDGTPISFRTESGIGTLVPTSCVTTDGTCTIKMFSSGNRAALVGDGGGAGNALDSGRQTVIAYTEGEESYTDLNGNGMYDSGEPFTDLPEAYIDANEDGVHQATEEFVDFGTLSSPADGTYTNADGLFNGNLRAAGLTGSKSISVRDSQVIVWSGSTANITATTPSIESSGVDLRYNLSSCTAGVKVVPPSTSFNLKIVDARGNIMPAGTLVKISTTNGILSSKTSYTVQDGTPRVGSVPVFGVTMQSDITQKADTNGLPICQFDNTVSTGTLTVDVITPLGTTTTRSYNVNDAVQ